MTASLDRRANRQTAVVMGVVGLLFVTLAFATATPLWMAAAAINFIGATDAILRHFYQSGAATEG